MAGANADGSGDHALPEFPSLNPNGPAPSWSPSGNQIVYQGFYFGGEPNTNAVYVENTDGSGSVTALTGDQGFSTYPSWRPSPSAAPLLFTPTSASGTPAAQALPVTLPKPTTVWITKRIFVTKGPDLTVIIGSYGCGGPSCGVSTEGKAKYAGPPAGLLASARAKTQLKNKRRQVVVAKGKTTIPGGQSGPVEMKLTKAGIKLLGKQGSLKIEVLVTITIPGQKTIVERRQVTVVLKKAKKSASQLSRLASCADLMLSGVSAAGVTSWASRAEMNWDAYLAASDIEGIAKRHGLVCGRRPHGLSMTTGSSLPRRQMITISARSQARARRSLPQARP